MNWVQAVDDMPGPEFLLLYGVVISVTFVICKLWVDRQDPSRTLPTPPVPKDYGPTEIAYLRGGENAVARLTVFGLLQSGYFEKTEEKKWFSTTHYIQHSSDPPDLNDLSSLERAVFNYFDSPKTADEVFPEVPGIVQQHCHKYQQWYEENNFLTTIATRTSAYTAGLIGALIILGLGGFKLLDALNEDRTNVDFLILMGIVSLAILAFICKKYRLTHLGNRYIKQLQLAFESHTVDPSTGVLRYPSGSTLFAAMGVLGISALDGTEFAYFGDIFKKAGSGFFVGGCGGGGGGGGGGCGGGGCGGG